MPNPGWMRRYSRIVSCLIALAVILSVPASAPAFRAVKEGAEAIAFTLKDLDGRDVEFVPASGKPTVLAFIQLSQERSVDEIRDLAALHEQMKAKGVAFLGIISGRDDIAAAKKCMADLHVAFPILVDAGQKVYGDYGVYILPATGIVGKDGKLLFEQSGHTREFRDIVGGRLKVLVGMMTETDYRRIMAPPEPVVKSREESEAEKEVGLGKTLIKRGMPEKAGDKFARAVVLDPKNVPARIAYGNSLVSANQCDNAMLQFEAAKKLDPLNKDAQLGIGTVHLRRGAVDNAIACISEATKLNPRPERAWFWLAAAYEKKGDFPNAVKFYRKVGEKVLAE